MKTAVATTRKAKFHEEVIATSDLNQMRGKFLAENLMRVWKEDFADEDTGEVVTIERKELIFEKGKFLSSDNLSEVNFYLQTNDITEVLVSNQQRSGVLIGGHISVWSVTVKSFSKKYTYLLYASSLQLAQEIIVDYLEQELHGPFILLTIKELEFSNLIAVEEDSLSKELDFYKVELQVEYEGDEPYNSTYILRSQDAETAKDSIVGFIATKAQEKGRSEAFEVTILSAKTIPCYGIVDYKFSEEYLNR